MSMQVDFQYPLQVEDVARVKAAVRAFERDMRAMMLFMKKLGSTFESVSHSFCALTATNYAGSADVRRYVGGLRENIAQIKEGSAFQDYNRLVHEEVLAPVKELREAVKAADAAMKQRDRAYKTYTDAKQKVDRKERSRAAKGKTLEESKSYPLLKARRAKGLDEFQEKSSAFQETFLKFMERVDGVTRTTMHRYLELNAGYMTTVVDALTRTDPSVEQHVALYRRQRAAERAAAMAHGEREVDERLRVGSAHVAPRGVADPRTSFPEAASSGSGQPGVRAPAGALDSTAHHCTDPSKGQAGRPVPGGPPAAMVEQAPTLPIPTGARSRPSHAPPDGPVDDPLTRPGTQAHTAAVDPRGRLTEVVNQRMNAVASRVSGEDLEGDGDEQASFFGSASQVNEAQLLHAQRLRAAALIGGGEVPAMDICVGGPVGTAEPGTTGARVYRFAPSTVAAGSQVSRGGYVARQTEGIRGDFLTGLEPGEGASSQAS